MFGNSAFRRHYFSFLLVIFVGFAVSLALSYYFASLERDRLLSLERERNNRPPGTIFRLIFEVSDRPLEETLRLANQAGSRFQFQFIARNSDEIRSLSLEDLSLLRTQKSVELEQVRATSFPQQTPLLQSLLFPAPRTLRNSVVIDFGHPDQLLLVEPKAPPRELPSLKPFKVTIALLFLAVIITTAIALSLMFSKYRKRADLAESVLAQLKSGNLAARMPVYKIDELSQLVNSFNHMADEIERLVTRLRENEARRMQVLQQLAHDLRTPLASMRTFLESLKEDRARMTEEQIQRALDLSHAECEYFTRLVEDLLTLASLGQPGPTDPAETIEMEALIRSVIAPVDGVHDRIQIHFEVASRPPPRLRGVRKLLERMIRNGLDNAVSFSRTEVHLSVAQEGEFIVIQIDDDGPGLSPAELEEFGRLRRSRRVEKTGSLRVSSGVGSVIMREIAEMHRGQVSITNRVDENGQTLGARLQIQVRGLPGHN